MKLRFAAIDQGGRVVRGVMRAESAEEAREILLDEGLSAKVLEEVSEEEALTWVAKERIKRRAATGSTGAAAATEARIVAAGFATTAQTGFDGAVEGQAGLTEDGRFVFEPRDPAHQRLVFSSAEVEVAKVSGIPARTLTITLLSGKMYEFSAGFILTNENARHIAKHLGAGRK